MPDDLADLKTDIVTLNEPRGWRTEEKTPAHNFVVKFYIKIEAQSPKAQKESLNNHRCCNPPCSSLVVNFEKKVVIVSRVHQTTNAPVPDGHWALGGLNRTITGRHNHGGLYCSVACATQ